MGLFSDVSAEDAKDVVFKATEKVTFMVEDANENLDKGYLKLELKVKSGEWEGRDYQYFINKKDKKSLASFALAVWSEEELEEDRCSVGDLVGQELTAVAAKAREYQGKTFQSLVQWAKAED